MHFSTLNCEAKMSNKSSGDSRQHGLTRSSSSSSASSTSSSSSSSSHRQRHRSRHHRSNRSKSGSQSRSAGSVRSRSRSQTRSRSRSSDRRQQKRRFSREGDISNDYETTEVRQRQAEAAGNEGSSCEGSSSDGHRIDDSIRSDPSSKSTTNGGHDDRSQQQHGPEDPGDRKTCRPLPTTKYHLAKAKAPSTSSRLSGIQFGKPGTVVRPGIHMKLAQPKPPTEQTKKITVASAFNNDSDEEVEEMPPECKMRMRNIGRDTPTSSGPNSFGKTKQGFIDSKKLFEKSLREAATD